MCYGKLHLSLVDTHVDSTLNVNYTSVIHKGFWTLVYWQLGYTGYTLWVWFQNSLVGHFMEYIWLHTRLILFEIQCNGHTQTWCEIGWWFLPQSTIFLVKIPMRRYGGLVQFDLQPKNRMSIYLGCWVLN